MRRSRFAFSYANVVSTLALLLAVSGAGAYAAAGLAPKSVGEKQLRPGAITPEKLRKNAVTAPKIKALAVKQGKLANGSITAAKIASAAVGTGALEAGAVTADKLAADSVTGEKVVESTLSQVPSSAKADFASTAESANPIAFARITAEATVDGPLSKNTASVSKGDLAGIYCVTALGFNPRGAQVTPQYTGAGAVTAYVTVGGTSSCPAPQVEVQTFEGAVRTAEPFYLSLYR